MDIKLDNIAKPSAKMKLMYEAVIELVKEGNDVSLITISQVTQRAGIGKGTAYEYFSSKDEIIVHALMYEFSNKLQNLAQYTFEGKGFKERVYRVMDWITENKEYNKMFTNVVKIAFPNKPDLCDIESMERNENQLLALASGFIFSQIDLLMEDGYKEGIIKCEDTGFRTITLLAGMVEYGTVIGLPPLPPFLGKTDDDYKDFIYQSLVKSLN